MEFVIEGLDGIDPNYAKNMMAHSDMMLEMVDAFLDLTKCPQREDILVKSCMLAAEYALKVEIGQVELQSDKHWDMFKQYLCKLIKQSVTHKKIKKAILEVVNHKDFKPDSWNSWNS